MSTLITFVLFTLSANGYPTAVWNYNTLEDCTKDGNRYKVHACLRVEVKKDAWRK